jgi:hypothetical protein
MADQFTFFPQQPQDTSTQAWGTQQVLIRTTFRERTGSWYMDILTIDEKPLAIGRRISPQFAPLLGLGLEGEGLPRDRYLVIDGPIDPYLKADLSDTLVAILLTQAEVDAAAAANQPGTFDTTVILDP